MLVLISAALLAAASASPSAPWPGVRQRGDLPPCPGVDPNIHRPKGSNCLGILPQQCGADRVQMYRGRRDTPALRAEIAQKAGHDRIRWYRRGQPLTADLRIDRLNVEIDRRGQLAKFDCS
jgi:Peptidase inhibitor I78 family